MRKQCKYGFIHIFILLYMIHIVHVIHISRQKHSKPKYKHQNKNGTLIIHTQNANTRSQSLLSSTKTRANNQNISYLLRENVTKQKTHDTTTNSEGRKQENNTHINCQNELFLNTTANLANIQLEFKGRMANNMIQYLYARAIARSLHMGLVQSVVNNTVDFVDNLHVFQRIRWHQADAANIASKDLCGGMFAQYYMFLKEYRAMAKCLFSPIYRPSHLDKRLMSEPPDVVIHYRDPIADGEYAGILVYISLYEFLIKLLVF